MHNGIQQLAKEKQMQTQEILDAISVLASFASQQQPVKSDRGGSESEGIIFCEPTKTLMYTPIFYVDDETGKFYEVKDGVKTLLEFPAFRGYIKQVKIDSVERRKKMVEKVSFHVYRGQDNRILEKAPGANFTKDLLFALAAVGEKLKTTELEIGISVPTERIEKTCFCNVVYAGTTNRVDFDRKQSYNPHQLIKQINSNLGVS